jgi:hypothetical protein
MTSPLPDHSAWHIVSVCYATPIYDFVSSSPSTYLPYLPYLPHLLFLSPTYYLLYLPLVMSDGKQQDNQLSPFGIARSTVKGEPLSKDELEKYTQYFNATMYIALG